MLLVGIFWFLLISFVGPVCDDLVRIGRLSQKLWDSGAARPVAFNQGSISSSPNILVVGDSFSASLKWQQSINKQATFLTVRADDFDSTCSLGQQVGLFLNKHPEIDIVIFQTAERMFSGLSKNAL